MTHFVPPVRRIKWGESHRYKDGNGMFITGTTTWIDQGKPKPQLAHWRGRTVAECAVNEWDDIAQMPVAKRVDYLRKAPDRVSDRAKARGTEVHALAEQVVAGYKVDIPEHLRGHVDSMVRLIDDWDVQAIALEATIYNLAHEWAGTCDALGHMRRHDGLGLIDWKTGSGVYPDYGLQLNCYANGTHYITEDAEHLLLPDIEWLAIGWIRDDGYEIRDIELDPMHYRAFRYVQQVAIWDRELSKSIIGPALRPPAVEATA